MSHIVARIALLTLTATLLATVAADGAQAQSEERCFPETPFCIKGRIRRFWEQNGGLPVFGLPIGPQQKAQVGGQELQVQWFERNRLEQHPENQPPYDVLLGRLGADLLTLRGRDPASVPRSEPQQGCRFFAETGHNVCGAILATWRASGLDLGQQGVTEAESLALFGLPLTEAQNETLSDGKAYQVQYFERARFELHPENQPPYTVLLGLLGKEVRSSGPAFVDAIKEPQGMGYPDQRKIARDSQGTLYVTYRKQLADSKYRIFVARSADGGASWGVSNANRPIDQTTSYDQRPPAIAVDSENTLHLVWYGSDDSQPGENARQIWYSRSSDGAISWSPPINVSNVQGYGGQEYWQEHPSLFVRGTTLTAVWEGLDASSGNEQRVKIARSLDGGRSWTAPQDVRPDPQYGDSRPTVVTSGDGGRIFILAYREREKNREVVWTTSADGGASWAEWRPVAPDSDDQRHVSLAIDGSDRLHAVWRQKVGGDRPQIVYASFDGKGWSAPEAIGLNQDASQFFPSIAVTAQGDVRVVWTESADKSGYPENDAPDSGQIIGVVKRAGQPWGGRVALSPAGGQAVYASLRWGGVDTGGGTDVVWMGLTKPEGIRHTVFGP